ncbi:flavin reductase family protein [Zavarzinia sp. CC-PAN008]|uniref:flavin reductase family protein n=1 Tax=Zavarzinia sp. CC-PAN008 TaxID=3243332 RepID=UPI003F7447DF
MSTQEIQQVQSREFRDALSCFATGVTIVTCRTANDRLLGFTASSFNSVSLDPPLVLFSMGRDALSFDGFHAGTHFAVNVLGQDQEHLSNRFASPIEDRFAGIAFDIWDSGCPVLHGAIAVFECETQARHDGGDHVIFVGEVKRLDARLDAMPLLFHRGQYRRVAP